MYIFILCAQYINDFENEKDKDILSVAYSKETLVDKVRKYIINDKENDYHISRNTNFEDFVFGKINCIDLFQGNNEDEDDNYVKLSYYITKREIEI